MKEENIKSEYQRKVDKSLIPTCNIMGVNIAAINMNWLLKYIDENLSDIKGDYICVSNAKKNNADLLLATDPDCDRVGIAVKNTQGEYVLLSGNETGMLLLDYICSRRTQMKTMPQDPVTVKTIVTIDMAERIAAKYGVKTINVLTGFKFIGEQIGFLEKQGKESSYIFGMEESYGYLSGSYVRDGII